MLYFSARSGSVGIPTARLLCLLTLLLRAVLPVRAQLEPAAQFTKLSVAQLLAWTPTGPTALPDNVSRVPLAQRQNTLATQLNPAQSFSHKVNYIPDGMSGFAGYLNEQNRFNLYNFTHWQYIDMLTWFDGPVALPTRPWVEAAHRNGVKVIGSVFTSAADVALLVQKTGAGEYVAAQKLVDVAAYYGFDGWFFNQEASVPAATALELRNLLKRLQELRPAGMEIHWYDAMLPGGAVSYQNALNANNQLLLQDGAARVSDAMFTNYFWSGAANINTSVNTATALGRSPFDVYMGADLWPNRNPQALFTQTSWINNYFLNNDLTQPHLSLGLFAANLTYNGGFNSFSSTAADYAAFYQTEQRVFAGNDLDPTTEDATGWKGFGHYVPVRSVINSLPFDTYFSVGQGKVFANNGAQLTRAWTDMSRQSLLPSWQWNKTGAAPITVGYDFSRAYYAGTSVRLQGSLGGSGSSSTVKLFQTKLVLPTATPAAVDITFKTAAAGPSNARLLLYFSDDLLNPAALDLGTTADTLWTTRTLSLASYAGRELAVIGVQAAAAAPVANYRLNLGRLKLYAGPAVTTKPTVGFTASATVVTPNQPVTFSNASTNATNYYWTFEGGTPATSQAVFPVVQFAAPGTYTVGLRAVNAFGRDSLIRTGYITVVNPTSTGPNSSLTFNGTSTYVDAGAINLTGTALSMECWLRPAAFKTSSPFISSVLGMEDGANTVLIRLGDAAQPANRLQFVMQLSGITRKLNSPTDLVANTWYHVAATYDGVTMRLYLNGQLDASLSAAGTFVANSNFFFARNFGDSRILNGSLDEVRVWTRALSSSELGNACSVAPNAPGLEGYWPLNEGMGTVAVDQTGHGHQGILVNMGPTNWAGPVPGACTVAAVGSPRRANGLQVAALGNPVVGSRAELEIRGARGQATQVQVLTLLGAVVGEARLRPAADVERVALPLPRAAGLYVVRVSTPTGAATVKVLRQ